MVARKSPYGLRLLRALRVEIEIVIKSITLFSNTRQRFKYTTVLSFLADVQPFYMGCYIDRKERALPDQKTHLQRNTGVGFTVQCIKYCQSKKQPYAGLQNHYECFCGTDYERYGKASESTCDRKCSDSTGRMCGGAWRLSVYSTRKYLLLQSLNV